MPCDLYSTQNLGRPHSMDVLDCPIRFDICWEVWYRLDYDFALHKTLLIVDLTDTIYRSG